MSPQPCSGAVAGQCVVLHVIPILGAIASLIFNNPAIHVGKTVGIVGEDRSCTEYAAIMSRVLGVTIRYRHILREIYAGLGFPAAEELANMSCGRPLFCLTLLILRINQGHIQGQRK